MAKWLKNLTVDRKSQVRIPGSNPPGKVFLYPYSPWETSIWQKGPAGKNQYLYLAMGQYILFFYQPGFVFPCLCPQVLPALSYASFRYYATIATSAVEAIGSLQAQ